MITERGPADPGPCPCGCNQPGVGFCGGCGHPGCGVRRRAEAALAAVTGITAHDALWQHLAAWHPGNRELLRQTPGETDDEFHARVWAMHKRHCHAEAVHNAGLASHSHVSARQWAWGEVSKELPERGMARADAMNILIGTHQRTISQLREENAALKEHLGEDHAALKRVWKLASQFDWTDRDDVATCIRDAVVGTG